VYAQIDPADTIPENDETNNLISRTITVQPEMSDTTPPTVDKFKIDGGSIRSSDETVRLDTWASDSPGGSGVSKLLFIEYVFVQSSGDWKRVRRSGWLSYKEASSGYKWKMSLRPGVHYFQVWAADRAGNVSTKPKSKWINHLPSPSYVSYLQHRVYRARVKDGQTLTIIACAGPNCGGGGGGGVAPAIQDGGVALPHHIEVRLYSPNGTLRQSCAIGQYYAPCTLSRTSHGGIWQWEVVGLNPYQRSAYDLSFQIKRATQAAAGIPHGAALEAEDQPIIAPEREPGTLVELPSAPLDLPRVYLPAVLRRQQP
jgi:hypothetical protein